MTLAFALVLTMALLGCSRSMGEAEYTQAFKASTEQFLAFGKELADRPLPDKSGMSREERQRTMAGLIRQDYARLELMAKEYEKLRPPAKFETLHKEYLEFLKGQHSRWMKYADQIEAGNREQMDRAGEEIDRFLNAQMKRLVEETKQSGIDVGDLQKRFNEFAETNH